MHPGSAIQPRWPSSFQTDLLLDEDVRLDEEQQEKQRQLQEAKAARRRQRHKEVVARSRLRQKTSATAIRQQEIVLGRRLHALLDRTGHSVELGSTVASVGEQQQQHDDEATRLHELHHKYAEQVAMQERIRLENDGLRQWLAWHDKLQKALNSDEFPRELAVERSTGFHDVEQQQDDESAATDSEGSGRGGGSWMFFEGDDEPFYYVALSEANCQQLMPVVYQRMLKLYSEFVQRRIPVSEVQFFGWRVQRPLHVDRRVLRFQFTKTVRCVSDSMDAIVDRTWTAFHDPKKFATIYSTPVTTRVIQRVNRDTTVLIQNAPVETGQEQNIRYFNILARVRGLNADRERVVALLKTIVNPSDCQGAGEVAPQLHEIEWMKRGISYLLLTEEPQTLDSQQQGRNIRLHYGCDFECVSEEHARYLMVEVLGIACRWEQLIMPSHCLTF
ncbi:hypothetical protein BBJ28_00016355 [Nothophytophthora sp. Chile5]|nr:hypothetical protein BBJ28_00016355 [Nothophytophthora sp. Chile5]